MAKEELDVLFSDMIEIANTAGRIIDGGKSDSIYFKYAKELVELKKKFNTQELNILVAGEVSTGKSTFINALLGVDLLETALEACTNVPTKIHFSETGEYVVHFFPTAEGIKIPSKTISRDEIRLYTSEKHNPQNKKNVAYLEIRINNPILSEGLVLIDTPGMGAIDPRHALATFNIAGEADIIFYLGRTDKQLTINEIDNLTNLIKCSKCDYVAHILTWSDKGHADDILNANKVEILKLVKQKNVTFFAVSSILYQRYLQTKDEDDLEDSGFQEVLSYVRKINVSIKSFLLDRYANSLLGNTLKIKNSIDELIKSATDPQAAEFRTKELARLIERLHEIEVNKNDWKSDLHTKQFQLNNEIKDFVNKSKQQIIKNIEDRLEEDRFLKDANALTLSIEADMIRFRTDLNDKIQKGMFSIYSWLIVETKLGDIREKIYTSLIDVERLELSNEYGDVPTSVKARNYIAYTAGMAFLGGSVMSVALGTSVGTAALAKIGAFIGNTVAPGVGIAIGAAIGCILGACAAVFQTKASKRRNILNKCREHVTNFFSSVTTAIDDANLSNTTELEKQFYKELMSDLQYCRNQHTEMSTFAQNLRFNWNNFMSLSQKVDTVYEKLTQ